MRAEHHFEDASAGDLNQSIKRMKENESKINLFRVGDQYTRLVADASLLEAV